MSDQRKGNRFGRQAITHERRQRTEILQQPQDAREEVEGGLEETMDMLKGNDRELRVIVDRRMVELKAENQKLREEVVLTVEMLQESQIQLGEMRELYEKELVKSIELVREVDVMRQSTEGRHIHPSDKVGVDHGQRVLELTRQIEIMKQLHVQELIRRQEKHDSVVIKLQEEKSHLQKFLKSRRTDDRKNPPLSHNDKKALEQQTVHNEEFQRILRAKIEELQQQMQIMKEQLERSETEKEFLRAKEAESEERYLEMAILLRENMEEMESLKGEKNILERTLDFSKKIAEEERSQFMRIIEIERQNSWSEMEEFRESAEQREEEDNTEDSNLPKKSLNHARTQLKVLSAFMSDFKKYYLRQNEECKLSLEALASRISSFLQSSSRPKSSSPEAEYEALIAKYKSTLRQKDKEIVQLMRTKSKYVKNIEYLNTILVDD